MLYGMQLDFDLRSGPPAPERPEKRDEPAVLTVGALTRKVRQLLESGVGEVWVEGEVSNVRRQSSGHVYFTLKDQSSQLACVMFASQAAQLRAIHFADGVQVQIFGQVTVYEARGSYQIIVRRVRERGVGELQAKFEALKRRLSDEGLFAQERKRPIPEFPQRIGVVTSPTGAAIRDFLHVLHRRQPGIEVLIFPVRVQGNGAAREIAEAVRLLGSPSELGIEPVDVIVVTRGGGSLEDLWEFNEESVARAIAASPVPVVSAVGHEIDFTISDFVADLRAPTPSAAAELLSADGAELAIRFQQLAGRLQRSVTTRTGSLRDRMEGFRRTVLFTEPGRVLLQRRQDADRLAEDLLRRATDFFQVQRLAVERSSGVIAANSPSRRIAEGQAALSASASEMARRASARVDALRAALSTHSAVLSALNPSAALARGYTMTLDVNGRPVVSATALSGGDAITTKFRDGSVRSVVSGPVEPPSSTGRPG